MTIPFEDIKICLNYNSAVHYPVRPNYLGELIDDLLNYGESIEKVLNNMRFFYGWEKTNNKWDAVARTEDDKIIYTTICMKVNSKVRLRDQDGLFHLAFYGHCPDTGIYIRVNTFEEMLKRPLHGLRVVFPVRPPRTLIEQLPTTTGSIPKRIDSSLYRF